MLQRKRFSKKNSKFLVKIDDKELKILKKGKNLQEKGTFNHQTKGWTYLSLV